MQKSFYRSLGNSFCPISESMSFWPGGKKTTWHFHVILSPQSDLTSYYFHPSPPPLRARTVSECYVSPPPTPRVWPVLECVSDWPGNVKMSFYLPCPPQSDLSSHYFHHMPQSPCQNSCSILGRFLWPTVLMHSGHHILPVRPSIWQKIVRWQSFVSQRNYCTSTKYDLQCNLSVTLQTIFCRIWSPVHLSVKLSAENDLQCNCSVNMVLPSPIWLLPVRCESFVSQRKYSAEYDPQCNLSVSIWSLAQPFREHCPAFLLYFCRILSPVQPLWPLSFHPQ